MHNGSASCTTADVEENRGLLRHHDEGGGGVSNISGHGSWLSGRLVRSFVRSSSLDLQKLKYPKNSTRSLDKGYADTRTVVAKPKMPRMQNLKYPLKLVKYPQNIPVAKPKIELWYSIKTLPRGFAGFGQNCFRRPRYLRYLPVFTS